MQDIINPRVENVGKKLKMKSFLSMSELIAGIIPFCSSQTSKNKDIPTAFIVF